jgi:hypothetical protein
MLYTIIIMFKSISSIVRRIDINAFDLASKLLLQRFKGKKVVAVNQSVFKKIIASGPERGVVGFVMITNKNSRLKFRVI